METTKTNYFMQIPLKEMLEIINDNSEWFYLKTQTKDFWFIREKNKKPCNSKLFKISKLDIKEV